MIGNLLERCLPSGHDRQLKIRETHIVDAARLEKVDKARKQDQSVRKNWVRTDLVSWPVGGLVTARDALDAT